MRYTAAIIAGKGRGKLLGFPTFNLEIPAHFKAQEGIYAADIWLTGGHFTGALHWGPIPVFKDTKPSLEIFVLDYASLEQPETLEFELKHYLRPIQNFSSPEALAAQIKADVEAIRKLA